LAGFINLPRSRAKKREEAEEAGEMKPGGEEMRAGGEERAVGAKLK